LPEQGFILFAGPLAGTEEDRVRALLIIAADSEAEIVRRLADDPWARTERLRLHSCARTASGVAA
jgi:hypothetical protein